MAMKNDTKIEDYYLVNPLGSGVDDELAIG